MHPSFRAPESSSRRTDVREGTNPQTSRTSTFDRSLYECSSSSRRDDRVGDLARKDQESTVEQYRKKLLSDLPPIPEDHKSTVETAIKELSKAVSDVESFHDVTHDLIEQKRMPQELIDGTSRNIYQAYGQALNNVYTSGEAVKHYHDTWNFEYKTQKVEHHDDPSYLNKIDQYIADHSTAISQIDTFLANQKAEYQRQVPKIHQWSEYQK